MSASKKRTFEDTKQSHALVEEYLNMMNMNLSSEQIDLMMKTRLNSFMAEDLPYLRIQLQGLLNDDKEKAINLFNTIEPQLIKHKTDIVSNIYGCFTDIFEKTNMGVMGSIFNEQQKCDYDTALKMVEIFKLQTSLAEIQVLKKKPQSVVIEKIVELIQEKILQSSSLQRLKSDDCAVQFVIVETSAKSAEPEPEPVSRGSFWN